MNPNKQPLATELPTGKWLLEYTTRWAGLLLEPPHIALTGSLHPWVDSARPSLADWLTICVLILDGSESILGLNKPAPFRPSGPIYQSLDVASLKASNQETWPFFNEVYADLTPESKSKVKVQFKKFKILGLIPVTAPESAKGELDVSPPLSLPCTVSGWNTDHPRPIHQLVLALGSHKA